jgi:hypothetical protein
MPMDKTHIELPGSEVELITRQGGQVTLRFSRALLVKSMTGSKERTRWWQAGELIFEQAEVEGAIPETPLVCDGGDLGENIYTYRDMIPIPLESQGRAWCNLRFRDRDVRLRLEASGVVLKMEDSPHYIEHIR